MSQPPLDHHQPSNATDVCAIMRVVSRARPFARISAWVPCTGNQRAFAEAARNEELERQLLEAATTKQTGVSLATLLSFGKQAAVDRQSGALLASAHFLKRELPIRFAHRILELDALPHGLAKMPSIRRVADWYRASFREIRSAPNPHTAIEERAFSELLRSIYERHGSTIVTIARGIFEYRAARGIPAGAPMPSAIEDSTKIFLDTFFTSRVGIRTLISQHLAMHDVRPFHVGIINTQCRPAAVIEDAAESAREMCSRVYGDAPDVHVDGDIDFVFPYVPAYIHHISFELLKNSLRAVMEHHPPRHASSGSGATPTAPPSTIASRWGGTGASAAVLRAPLLPPVRVVLSASTSSEDVVIKTSDEGGGIPRSAMPQLFSYFFTTATPTFKRDDDAGEAATPIAAPAGFGTGLSNVTSLGGGGDGGQDFTPDAPMSGLGVGLPLSRVYARYFGGELMVISMEGWGTDCFVYLPRLGDAAEPLSECSAEQARARVHGGTHLPNVSRGGVRSRGAPVSSNNDGVHGGGGGSGAETWAGTGTDTDAVSEQRDGSGGGGGGSSDVAAANFAFRVSIKSPFPPASTSRHTDQAAAGTFGSALSENNKQ